MSLKCFINASNALRIYIDEYKYGDFFIINASYIKLNKNNYFKSNFGKGILSFMVPIYSNKIENYLCHNYEKCKNFHFGKIDFILKERNCINDYLRHFKKKLIKRNGL